MSEKTLRNQKDSNGLGWKHHWMSRRDGKGGWIMLAAQCRFVHFADETTSRITNIITAIPRKPVEEMAAVLEMSVREVEKYAQTRTEYSQKDFPNFCPFGVAQMDNGEVLFLGSAETVGSANMLAGYRRGCEALVSRDNGQTWDVSRRYMLDEFEFFDGKKWFNGETGHLCSTLLNDGRVLTVYGKYTAGGACLIRWRP